MNSDSLFCFLNSLAISKMILGANRLVCFASPGVNQEVAKALIEVAGRLGPETISVCLDFDERVMRMGYGDLDAVDQIMNCGISVRSASGLRTSLVIVDDSGFIFTPTPLYLEAEPDISFAPNAVRMSREQTYEALARLSSASKAIAIAQANTNEKRELLEALPIDLGSEILSDRHFYSVKQKLDEAPPVKFDLARQVRVFEPYLQYVELSLIGAAIQRHRLAIPPSIQKLGGSKELEARLRTTFELIEKDSKFSSKPLENELNQIRNDLTRSLGKDHGRVLLKSAKSLLLKRISELEDKLNIHKDLVKNGLQKSLDTSRKQIINYYSPLVIANPPDAFIGQLFTAKPTKKDAEAWIDAQLDRVFPTADSLIIEMKIEKRFKDVTFETLNHKDFLISVKNAFPNVDWDKTYSEFKAAGELKNEDKNNN